MNLLRTSMAVMLCAAAAPARAASAAPPTFSPPAGTFNGPQTVTVSDTAPGARIYYTTDGTKPTTSSTLYSGPITVSATTTVKALAAAAGYSNSSVASAQYKLVAERPTFSPPATGVFYGPQMVTMARTRRRARRSTTRPTAPRRRPVRASTAARSR